MLFCNFLKTEFNPKTQIIMFYKKILTAVSAVLFTSLLFAQSTKLTDADIANIGVTANQIDVDHAAVAKKISTNQVVLDFADMMQKDHTAVIDQAVALVKKLGVTPTNNDVSKSLMKDAKAQNAELYKLKGKSFDKAYLENEVAYHKAVIAMLNTKLIPGASNAELKAFLQGLVAPFEGHLKYAQMALEKIK